MVRELELEAEITALRAALAERETDLQKLTLRYELLRSEVKNNLHALSLTFASQSRRSLQAGLCRKCVVQLSDASALHQALAVDEIDPVSMADYLPALSGALMTSFDKRIRSVITVDPTILLEFQRATCVGAIFIEAVAKALKYAFPGLSGGEIISTLRRDGNALKLVVSDNGCGFDPGLATEPGGGLAFMQEVAGRLSGSLGVATSRAGTTLTLVCPA